MRLTSAVDSSKVVLLCFVEIAKSLGNGDLCFEFHQRTLRHREKMQKSRVELRPCPSAMLDGTETAARRIWLVKAYISVLGKSLWLGTLLPREQSPFARQSILDSVAPTLLLRQQPSYFFLIFSRSLGSSIHSSLKPQSQHKYRVIMMELRIVSPTVIMLPAPSNPTLPGIDNNIA